jgi:hypothetical protein
LTTRTIFKKNNRIISVRSKKVTDKKNKINQNFNQVSNGQKYKSRMRVDSENWSEMIDNEINQNLIVTNSK